MQFHIDYNVIDLKNIHSKRLWMLILFIWAGLATPLVKFYSPEYPFVLVINLLLCFYFYFKYQNNANGSFAINYNNPLLLFALGSVCWYFMICMKYGSIQKTDFTLFYSAFIGYISFKVFPSFVEFLKIFEDVLVKLCLLSLFVWISVTLFPFMSNVYDSLAIYKVTGGLDNSSFILFGYGHQMAGIFHRNLGFAWEAGRFASFIVIGLFFNLCNHNMKITVRKNLNFWILFLTLISTFSTTGIVAFAAIVICFFYNKSVYSKTFMVIIGALVIPSIVALPFIGEKIITSSDYNQEMSNMLYSFTVEGRTSITPQRITGLYLEIQNFINDPLLGYNINEKSYVMNYLFRGYDVWLSDGFLQIFSKYGIFVGLFFYYNLFNTSKFISTLYKVKGQLFFFLIFILISFSYDFWGTGLTFYIVFYTFFQKDINKSVIF